MLLMNKFQNGQICQSPKQSPHSNHQFPDIGICMCGVCILYVQISMHISIYQSYPIYSVAAAAWCLSKSWTNGNVLFNHEKTRKQRHTSQQRSQQYTGTVHQLQTNASVSKYELCWTPSHFTAKLLSFRWSSDYFLQLIIIISLRWRMLCHSSPTSGKVQSNQLSSYWGQESLL